MTIFDRLSLDRRAIRWEEYLRMVTPIHERGGMFYKREDFFAPLGYGGINGSKLRQCIHLIHRYYESGPVDGGVLSASSVKSPQVSMTTAVARHYGYGTTHILGATKLETAMRHENVFIAAQLGARFTFIPVAYNPALQRRLGQMAEAHPECYRMEYGISLPETASGDEIADFHALGANQVQNLPECENLIIPAGSCVTAASILLGVAQERPRIKKIWLIGIGPSRIRWLEQRLADLEEILDMPILYLFERDYPEAYADLVLQNSAEALYRLRYIDLHGAGIVDYQSETKWHAHGIDFHPTYEGKVMHYLAFHHPELLQDDRSCFWIVGSRPSWRAMRAACAGFVATEQLQLGASSV